MKKIILLISSSFIFIGIVSLVVLSNPVEVCGCLPEYEGASHYAWVAAKDTLAEALANGNLEYNDSLLQFEGDTMESFKNKITNPYDVWYIITDDEITELLYKTERTVKYAGIFPKKQTIYLLNSLSYKDVFTSRPKGW